MNIASLSDVSSTNDCVFAIFVSGATDCPNERMRDSVCASEFDVPGFTPHADHRSISLSCHDVRIFSCILCQFGREDLGRVRNANTAAKERYMRASSPCDNSNSVAVQEYYGTLCMTSGH
jgi:hypothetical protein